MNTRARFPIEGVNYRCAAEVDELYAKNALVRFTVGDVLRQAALEFPDKLYVISADGQLTFSELDRKSEALAASFASLGLEPGDRALFQMGTVIETIIALFGCYKAGVLPVCTLPQHRELEIGQLARLSKPRAFFVQADFSPSFDQVGFARRMAADYGIEFVIAARGGAGDSVHSLEQLIDGSNYEEACLRIASIAIDPEDVLSFQLSGGSTGVPKIIPRMHGEYLAQARSWAQLHEITEKDVCLWPLPLIHNAAMVLIVLPALVKRSTIVIQERFDMMAFLEAIERFGVTYAGSIGPIAPRLLEYPDLTKHNLSTLRMFFALDRADALERHIGIPAANMYGITEGLLTSSRPDDVEAARHDTIGRPSSEFEEVRVLVPGSEALVPVGQEGELCFRGPSSLRGYYNAPDINAESFTKDGFFRSGDLVREISIDGQSYYAFSGRLKDNISRGNEKFAAEEVERLIVRHPSVMDAKVVAMPDRIFGEKACAFIIPNPGVTCPTTGELGLFLAALGLAKYKLPERVEAVSTFPVTRVGKVDKKAMREMIAAMVAAEYASATAYGPQATTA